MWFHSLMTAQEIDNPPELFYVMKSIADFGKKWNEQTPITKLAEVTKDKIFYDTYPLSRNVDKDTFEINILNHFIRERIAFDTVTSFKIALVTKLREIMPKYNSMFDLVAQELDLFYGNYEHDVSEKTDDDFINRGTKESEENGQYHKEGTKDATTTGEYSKEGDKQSDTDGTTSKAGNTSETGQVITHTEGERTEDLRESDTPQNALADVQNGSYVSKYNYNKINTEEDKQEDSSKSGTYSENGTSNQDYDENWTEEGTNREVYDEDWTEDGTDKTNYEEGTTDTGERDINRVMRETSLTRDNLVARMHEYNEIQPIMTMIYNDLDALFLQVYDY